MSPAASVEAFLAALPPDQRAALEALRKTIRGIVPDAQESIGYGVPAFKYRGRPLVSFGAGKNHYAFYVQSPAVMEAHRKELQDFETSTGTVRFSPAEPLPEDLVLMLVKARIDENEAAVAARRARR